MKKSQWSSINILSVLLILVSVFACSFYGVNSWFTQTHNNGVEIYIELSDVRLSLYQVVGQNVNLLTPLGDDGASYVSLSGAVIPDQNKELKLVVGNDQPGSSPVYVKFKFALYARGVDEDVLISTTINGFSAQTATSAGFKYNEQDEFYYYCDNSGEPMKLDVNNSADLMTSFVIDYQGLYNDGELLNYSSESIYIVLTVEANLGGWETV